MFFCLQQQNIDCSLSKELENSILKNCLLKKRSSGSRIVCFCIFKATKLNEVAIAKINSRLGGGSSAPNTP